MKYVPSLILGMAIALLGACASDPTTSNLDPTADLSKYNTYAFLTDLATDKGQRFESLETNYLKNAVAAQLESRGMTRDEKNPDVLFNFSIQTQEKVKSTPTGGAYGGVGYDPFFDEYYYGGWGYGNSMRIDQYTEGKLVIDAIDPVAKKLIWQGSTRGRLTTKDLQNMEETLTSAVNEIFTKLPPVAQ